LNDSRERSKLSDILETATKYIVMYREVELQLATTTHSKDVVDFEKSLVKLYSNILYFLACAANHLKHGTFVQTAKNIIV